VLLGNFDSPIALLLSEGYQVPSEVSSPEYVGKLFPFSSILSASGVGKVISFFSQSTITLCLANQFTHKKASYPWISNCTKSAGKALFPTLTA